MSSKITIAIQKKGRLFEDSKNLLTNQVLIFHLQVKIYLLDRQI